MRTHALSSKQKRERAFFVRFLESLPELTGAPWSQQEKPDFVLRYARRRVGVEVTRLMVSDRLKEEESFRNMIVRKARRAYHEQVDKPLLVWFSFARRLRVSKAEAGDISRQLGRVVATEAVQRRSGRIEKSQLPQDVSSVTFFSLKQGAMPVWGAVESGFNPKIEDIALDAAIQKKNEKLQAYLETCDEAWLLVAVEGFQPSTWYDISGEALSRTYQSSFARAYILDFQGGRVHRLALGAPCV